MKLTIVRLPKDEAGASVRPSEATYHDTVQLLGYCMQGRDEFIASNSVHAAKHAEKRLHDTIAAGDSLDARPVLLALHAGVIASDIGDRFGFESG